MIHFTITMRRNIFILNAKWKFWSSWIFRRKDRILVGSKNQIFIRANRDLNEIIRSNYMWFSFLAIFLHHCCISWEVTAFFFASSVFKTSNPRAARELNQFLPMISPSTFFLFQGIRKRFKDKDFLSITENHFRAF